MEQLHGFLQEAQSTSSSLYYHGVKQSFLVVSELGPLKRVPPSSGCPVVSDGDVSGVRDVSPAIAPNATGVASGGFVPTTIGGESVPTTVGGLISG